MVGRLTLCIDPNSIVGTFFSGVPDAFRAEKDIECVFYNNERPVKLFRLVVQEMRGVFCQKVLDSAPSDTFFGSYLLPESFICAWPISRSGQVRPSNAALDMSYSTSVPSAGCRAASASSTCFWRGSSPGSGS
jgi:hypothetical protein